MTLHKWIDPGTRAALHRCPEPQLVQRDLPIDKLDHHHDGSVEVYITDVDGRRCRRTYGPDEQVMVQAGAISG